MILLIVLVLIISLYGFYFPELMIDTYYVLLINVAYLLISIYYLIRFRKYNLFCPELIIFATYYFSSYLLIYAIDFGFREIYVYEGIDLIKAVSLATIGWLFFLIGAFYAHKFKLSCQGVSFLITFKKIKIIKRIIFILLILFIAAYIYNDFTYLRYKYSGAEGSISDMFSYVTILILFFSVYEFIRLYQLNVRSFNMFIYKVDKLYIFTIIFLFILVFIVFGNRSGTFQFILPIVLLYNVFIKKISILYLILLGVLSFFYSVFMAFSRDLHSFATFEITQMSDLFIDFMSVNAAIPILINYVEINGISMGANMIYQLLSVIPFAQSFAKYILDIKSDPPSSVVNSIELLGVNYHSGQGTNVTADLFYSFGIIGVMCGMCLIGFIYAYMFNKILSGRFNVYFLFVFLVLFGNVIFFSRVEYAYIIRSCSYVVIYAYLLNCIFIKR